MWVSFFRHAKLTDPIPFRYTGLFYQRILLPLALCFLCPKETNQLKASRMTAQSFSREILCPSSGTFSGRYMPCELDWFALTTFRR